MFNSRHIGENKLDDAYLAVVPTGTGTVRLYSALQVDFAKSRTLLCHLNIMLTCSITMTHNDEGNGLAASLSNTVAMPDSLALVEQAAFRVVSVATDMALGIKLGGRSRGIRGGQGGAGAVIKMDMLQAHFPDQQYDMMNPRTRLAAMSMTWGAVAVSGFGASEPPSLKLLMHNTELNTVPKVNTRVP